jgi:hypothetical protein
MCIYTLAVSGADRVEAVHREFAGRSTQDAVQVLGYAFVGVVLLFLILAAANHIQGSVRKRAEAEHRAEVDARMALAEQSRKRFGRF